MFADVSQYLDFGARQPSFSCQRAHIIDIKYDWMFQSYLIHYCVPVLSQTPFVYIRRECLYQVVVFVVCVCGIIRFLLYFRSSFKAQSREETLNL